MASSDATELLSSIRTSGQGSWGFTLYRTAYGPKADSQWPAFIEKLYLRLQDEIRNIKADTPAQLDTLCTTFRLDIKSDTDILHSASMDSIRQMHRDFSNSMEALPERITTRVVLLIDDEALNEAEGDFEHWVKAVEIDYDPELYNKWHPRMGGQRYFGWMKASTDSLVFLWEELIIVGKALPDMAPQTIGGMMLRIWPTDN